jgi:peroxiredoxin
VWLGRLAPDIEVPMLDGSTLRLADHVGQRVVVLNFFATWCGPCRQEMPELQRYIETLAKAQEPFTFVAIDVEEKRSAVEKFITELSLTMPIGLDESGDIAKQYGVNAFPTTVVIGADGRVKLFESGAIANADVSLWPSLKPEIDAIRQGRGIKPDAWRAALAAAPKGVEAADEDATPSKPALTGRARHIADTMTCPCGCSNTVTVCTCHTAKGIKDKLAASGSDPNFAKQTDAEVMTSLNREFCMKGM